MSPRLQLLVLARLREAREDTAAMLRRAGLAPTPIQVQASDNEDEPTVLVAAVH